jgi:hypothetical protein
MKLIVRLITGVTLVVLSVRGAMHGNGFVRLLASVELITAAMFCLPRVWRIGGYGLLGVLAIAITHHAMRGEFASGLLFAALVIILELTP